MSGTPRILTMFPPNFREIDAAFNVRGKPVIYAYGDTIYNPKRIKIPPYLIEHERVHLQHQGGDPATWWRRYIDDRAFRYAEELPAHIAEYRQIYSVIGDGSAHEQVLSRIAERLASPLYGGLIDVAKAKEIIRHAGEGATCRPL